MSFLYIPKGVPPNNTKGKQKEIDKVRSSKC